MVQNNQHKEGLLLLHELQEKSAKKQEWETLAGTCVALARFYQKIYRDRESRSQLEQARSIIEQHHLDTQYPALYTGFGICFLAFRIR